jgi:diaminopimelate decarboxylase
VSDELTSPVSELPIGRHLLPENARIAQDGRLSIAGVDLCELADAFGTPVFVYDEEHLRARCKEAVEAFGPCVAYATKAFLCKEMARLVVEEGMVLDVSTMGELAVARAAGVPPERLVMHGNNKSQGELEAALELSVRRIAIDSFDEIDRLREMLANGTSRERQPVLIRVTPGIEAHTHAYVMTGNEDTKFGFSVASGAAEEGIEAIAAIPSLKLVGIHAHIGSQIFDLDAFVREVEVLAPLIQSHGLSELCIGGGLGVAYLNDERAASITAWAREVRATCKAAGLGKGVSVYAEPGRAIVATAGLTCYRVGTIKRLTAIRNYVAVDGGMSDNPRPVLYGAGYEAFLARAADAQRTFDCRVVGKHCESGDVIVAEGRLPQDVAIGDVLVTPVTGAYGYAMASNYNRVPRAPVVFVRDGKARAVVRRETVEDLLHLEP